MVGAGEEVLCWDIKKGELIGRWKDNDCRAEVTVIAQSKADPDIHAIGYARASRTIGFGLIDKLIQGTEMVPFVFGTRPQQRC